MFTKIKPWNEKSKLIIATGLIIMLEFRTIKTKDEWYMFKKALKIS